MDYVQEHISENIKVNDIAAYFGYNPKYLSTQFSQTTGYSLKQFILHRKIDAANFMLTDSRKSVSEIACLLGFPNSHSFSRTYKHITGMTPSEYRGSFSKEPGVLTQ